MGEKPVSKTESVNSYRFKTPPGAPLHTLDLKSDGRPTKIDHFKGVPPEEWNHIWLDILTHKSQQRYTYEQFSSGRAMVIDPIAS